VAADLWRALSQASGVDVEAIARSWIEQDGYPVVEHTVVEREDGFHLQLRQERFYQQPPKQPASGKWAVPWVGRVGRGRSGGGQLVRHMLTRKRDSIALGKRPPRFVYGNANEGGFFRPAHGTRELSALGNALPSLAAVERMGLVDHQWALVCAGREPIGALLDLAADLADEHDPDVLAAVRQPLAFIAHTLIPDAASAEEEHFREWLQETFEPAFSALGWAPARNEPDDVRVRRAVLLAIVGGAAASDAVVRKATELCDAYLKNRRSLDANLTDGVVALAARRGGKGRYRRYLAAARTSDTPQETRRFLLATADFRDPDRIDETLAMSLTDRVPTQDVIFLLGRLMANPAARERTWSFIKRRWPKLRKRMPSLFASRLIEATPSLLTPAHRKDVARFFRENPVPSGDRALRQALERFDWYRGFRRGAAADLRDWLERRSVD
jgi:aminopeptidase N